MGPVSGQKASGVPGAVLPPAGCSRCYLFPFKFQPWLKTTVLLGSRDPGCFYLGISFWVGCASVQRGPPISTHPLLLRSLGLEPDRILESLSSKTIPALESLCGGLRPKCPSAEGIYSAKPNRVLISAAEGGGSQPVRVCGTRFATHPPKAPVAQRLGPGVHQIGPEPLDA